jgi:hypothetical protein
MEQKRLCVVMGSSDQDRDLTTTSDFADLVSVNESGSPKLM